MSKDRIRGKTIRFTFTDGPMAKKTFEHVFAPAGVVSFRMVEAARPAALKNQGSSSAPVGPVPETPYETVTLRDDLAAVSYLSSAGYTLTALLDFETNELVAFSSNEKSLGVQHGTFEVSAAPTSKRRNSRHADVHR